jgi:hypothetical protein
MNKKFLILIPALALLIAPLSASAVALNVTTSATAAVSVPTVMTDVHAGSSMGSMSASASAKASTTPTAVSSDADLNAYTSTAIATDTSSNAGVSSSDTAEIKNVTYQDDGVTVQFTQPAKFIGLFPMSIDATAVAKGDGTVTVSYPWYGFLVRKHEAAINSIFQAQVTEATAGQNVSATASASTMSPSMKAIIFDAMRQAIHGLKSKAAVSASTSTSASGY